jgi:hypothetical protein
MRFLLLVAMASAGLLLAGCGDSGKTPPTKAGKTQDGPGDEIAANLAKLSAADRAAAEKQGDCPVSGEKLGSMGVPIKVTVKERDVWLCCKSCEKPLKADPDKYLAKIKAE